ncbi:MAG: Chromosome-partitioning protein Spo0J [Syntrophorhabdaceae bacterium PtaU1.Bin034]|jgi:ParB family chromosome partitioning protein|nr:MAG: Chromosome-partitioning protein Spo0J [Syntrophorhabdaceae bacterium PtaU1.Bin034]
MSKKDPLGRGLSAILKDVDERGGISNIPIQQILPNPTQPRIEMREEPLLELAASIKEKGLLQPILVRRKEGVYEIIAGERRFRAAKMAGLKEVPVIVRDADDREALELAMIENLQREDLNPIEIAMVYQRFLDDFDYTHEELAKKVGVERSSVSNYVRLLKLPDWIQDLMTEGKLTQGHGRVLITLNDEHEQRRYVNKVLTQGLSVRELERTRKSDRVRKPSPFSRAEEMLREALQTKVQVTFRRNKGKVIIEFYSKDDLERLLEIFAD